MKYDDWVQKELNEAANTYRSRYGRQPSVSDLAHFAWQRLKDNRQYDNWLRAIREDDVPWEYDEEDGDPDPDPDPDPGGNGDHRRAEGRVRAHGGRAFEDDAGSFLAVGLTRFSWLRDWKFDRDRVIREIEADAANGYDYARVLGDVRGDYWNGRETDSTWSDHSELVAGLTRAAYVRGIRILWTLCGDCRTDPTRHQSYRLGYVRRMGQVLKEVSDGVLFVEMVNEFRNGAVGPVSIEHIFEMADEFRAQNNGFLVATGAVGDPGDGSSEGATGFSPDAWGKTQYPMERNGIGICHLDRDQSKSEREDRPWRQGWDVGLCGWRWCDNEPIGPGSSVSTENRPEVLRSHKLVSFICRAAASCFHGEFGVRGDRGVVTPNVPGYTMTPRAKRFLPGNLPNGWMHNANERYPGRPFHVSDDYIRSVSGKGCVRVYTCEAPDGRFFTVPFGVISTVKLVARFPLHIKVWDQQAGGDEPERMLSLDKGESFDLPACTDRLIEARRA
jgi:hypothetical protein